MTEETLFRPQLSWSQYRSLMLGCGKQYELERLVQVSPKAKGYFIGGRAVHATIEESEATGWWGSVDTFAPNGVGWRYFRDQLDSEVAEHGEENIDWGGRKTKDFPGGEDVAWWHFNGGSMLRRYAALRREDVEKRLLPQPTVEVELVVTLPSGRIIKGYIDQLFPDRSRDYKTGRSYKVSDLGLQLATYEYGLRQLGHEPRTLGEYIFLRSSDGRILGQVNLDRWVRHVEVLFEQMERRLEAHDFAYAPSMQNCGTCGVLEFCEIGRDVLIDKEGELP